jgi:hypothetical protein
MTYHARGASNVSCLKVTTELGQSIDLDYCSSYSYVLY